jgi:hypothetical protein
MPLGDSRFLSGIEKSFGIECLLDPAVESEGSWIPLLRQVRLAPSRFRARRRRSRQAPSECEKFASCLGSSAQFSKITGGVKKRRVEVAVSRVSPGAGFEVMASPDFYRRVDRFA